MKLRSLKRFTQKLAAEAGASPKKNATRRMPWLARRNFHGYMPDDARELIEQMIGERIPGTVTVVDITVVDDEGFGLLCRYALVNIRAPH